MGRGRRGFDRGVGHLHEVGHDPRIVCLYEEQLDGNRAMYSRAYVYNCADDIGASKACYQQVPYT